MKATMVLACAIASMACLPARSPAQGSRAPTPIAALNAVMEYRRFFLNDTSRFQVCSVARALGGEDAMAALGTTARALIEKGPGCGSEPRIPESTAPIAVVTIAGTDSASVVKLAVQYGEYSHLETYTVKQRNDRPWVAGVSLTSGTFNDLVRREPTP